MRMSEALESSVQGGELALRLQPPQGGRAGAEDGRRCHVGGHTGVFRYSTHTASLWPRSRELEPAEGFDGSTSAQGCKNGPSAWMDANYDNQRAAESFFLFLFNTFRESTIITTKETLLKHR